VWKSLERLAISLEVSRKAFNGRHSWPDYVDFSSKTVLAIAKLMNQCLDEGIDTSDGLIVS